MKPYTRGSFRAVKSPKGTYHVQAGSLEGSSPNTAHLRSWMTVESFDYLGNARLRVRNLHAASCTMLEASWHRSMARRWINLGKNFSFATPREEAAQRAREHLRWAREAKA